MTTTYAPQTRTIRVDPEVYAFIKKHQLKGESFNQTLRRLFRDQGLL